MMLPIGTTLDPSKIAVVNDKTSNAKADKFLSWNTDKDAKTALTEYPIAAGSLFAIWGSELASEKVTIEFDANYEGAEVITPKEINKGEVIDLSTITVTREDIDLAGWDTDPKADPTKPTYAKDDKYTADADAKFFAIWTKTSGDTFTVTFSPNGGSAVTSQTVKSGETATEPAAPNKDGFTFGGWYTEGKEYDFKTPVTANITLYAKWTDTSVVNKFTVTFNSNGGNAVAAQTVNEGEKATKPDDPTKADNVFGGWYEDADCTKEYDFSKAVDKDITLYAKWTPVPESINAVVMAKPEVNTDKLKVNDETGLDSAAIAAAAVESVKPSTESTNILISDAVGMEELAVDKDDPKVVEKVKELGAGEGDTVRFVLQTFIDINVTDYNPKNFTLSMDITPKAQTVATTVEAGEENTIITTGDGKNAVVVKDAVLLKVTKPITLSVTLTNIFKAKKDSVFVKHTKKDNNYEYRAKYLDDDDDSLPKFQFVNPHSFSEFQFTTTTESSAWIGDTGYTSLQAAMNDADDEDEIELVKSVGPDFTVPNTVKFKQVTVFTENEEVKFNPDHQKVCYKDVGTKKYTVFNGHIWDAGTITTEATETTSGVKTFKCTNCTDGVGG